MHGPRPDELAAATALSFLVFVPLIAALLGAMFLRAACSAFNRFCGGRSSPGAVPEPGFGRAMGIALAIVVINAGIRLPINIFGADTGLHSVETELIAFVVSFPTMALAISVLLPTTYTRAFLVAFLDVLIAIICCAAVVVPIMIALTVTGGMR